MPTAQEARNEKRRAEYAKDKTYRQICTEASRDKYRRDKGVSLKNCLGNLASLSSFGNVREVTVGDAIEQMLCFTVKELSDILGYTPTNIYRWQSRDMFPEPIAKAKIEMYSKARGETYESTQKVYLEAETQAIVQVIGEHQSELCYYRKADIETTNKLYASVAHVRKKYEG